MLPTSLRPSPARSARAASAALLCLFAANQAAADVVTLTNGSRLEGRTRRTDAGLVLSGRYGETVIPWRDVAHLEERLTPAERFARERRALAPGDLAGAARLAGFALDHDLEAEARALLEPYARLSPRDPALRAPLERLLFRFEQGRWVPPEVHFPRRGWVRLRGKWRSPQEVEKLRSHDALVDVRQQRDAAREALAALERRIAWDQREVARALREQAELKRDQALLPERLRAAEAALATRAADLAVAEQALLQAQAEEAAWRRVRWRCPLEPCGHAQGEEGPRCRRGQRCPDCERRCRPQSPCRACRAHRDEGQRLARRVEEARSCAESRRRSRSNALERVQELARLPERIAAADAALAKARQRLAATLRRRPGLIQADQATQRALLAAEARFDRAKAAAKGAPAARK